MIFPLAHILLPCLVLPPLSTMSENENHIISIADRVVSRSQDLRKRCRDEMEKLEGRDKWEFAKEIARLTQGQAEKARAILERWIEQINHSRLGCESPGIHQHGHSATIKHKTAPQKLPLATTSKTGLLALRNILIEKGQVTQSIDQWDFHVCGILTETEIGLTFAPTASGFPRSESVRIDIRRRI
ncbi:hypothetical protein BGX38DRAFT_134090 [Terfezia claveryi]|nr:hypothetical protein BGX38DRAFT_134090 [Terfezia claveryi]